MSSEQVWTALCPAAEAVWVDELVNSGHAVALFDKCDFLRYANQTFLDLFAIGASTQISFADIMLNCHRAGVGLIIENENFGDWLADVQSRRRAGGRRSFEADFRDGRWVWASESHRSDGWVCFIGVDITQLKTNEKVLRHAHDRAMVAANTDALTGLYNRRFMTAQMQKMVDCYGREPGENCCVAMLDLDHFKQINDQFGHQIGDQVLRHFADLTRSLLRPGDSLGRIGGEEFLLVLPDIGLGAACAVVERLRHALQTADPCPQSPGLAYTFSCGMTHIEQDDTCDSVLSRADLALYRAKDSGRNRSEVAGDGAIRIGVAS